jgi:hypothetical protein
MHAPIRIEVPDEEHAASLRRFLQLRDVATSTVNGHCEVSVDFIERNPERRIVDLLSAIDRWLPTTGLQHVQVHLDGSSYTLTTPAAHETKVV